MPHNLSPWQAIVLSVRFLLIPMIALFQTSFISGQCMMVPLSLDDQASTSHLIVEGVVKEKSAFITAAGNFIYTIYQIEVTKIFKGQLEKSIVQVVEAGGAVGNRRIEVSPSINLEIEEAGTFFLERFIFKDPQDGQRFSETVFRAYASSQSVFSYDLDNNTVIGHFNQFELDDWYDQMIKATGKHFEKVKEFSLPVKYRSNMAPTISSMTPLTITSGSFSVLTINGNGFGAVQGTSTVEFKNPDDGGGTWVAASSAHTMLWTNTQLQIKVPYKAGSGQVRVTVSAMSTTSSQSLAIGYSQYNIEYNVPPLSLFKVQLRNMSGIGGYTFRYHTELNSNMPARKSFERALNSWRCAMEVNFIIGDVTSVDVVVQDGINVVRFDNGNEIPAGVGAQTLSYFDDCLSLIPPTIDIVEIDLVFNDAFEGVTWEYGPDLPTGTEVDFESISLHELGHANCLGHVISTPEVLHYSIGPGEHKRVLSANDIAGGTYVHAQSTSNPANCGNNVMTDYRQVKYVDVGTTGIQSGDTWAQAYKYLQDALAVTTACVDTIYVAAGTYYPDEGAGLANNNQLLRFTLSTPVVVMGGYESATGLRNLSVNLTNLSGDIEQDGLTDAENSQNIVRMSSTATLDGFTIQRGYADAASGEGRDGGGIYVSASGTIRNCTFRNNIALGKGGAAYQSGGSPAFTNCQFYSNNAITFGAAITLTTSSASLTNCTIASNVDPGFAAMRIEGGNHLFRNSIIWNNTSDFSMTAGTLDVTNSMIQAPSFPAGVTGTNVLFNTNPQFANQGGNNFSLVPCSPAVNTGNNTYNTFPIDILGNNRLIGGIIDRGSFEHPTGIPSTIVLNTSDSGAGSLRTIVANACPGNTITFSNTLLNQTILLTGPQIEINKNVIIDGLGIDNLTVSANGTHRHFNQLPGTTATIKNISLTQGDSAANGNCICTQGILTLQNIRLVRKVGATNPINLANNSGANTTFIGQVFMQ